MRLLFSLLITYTFLQAGGILDIKWPKINNAQQKARATYPSVLVEGTKDVRLPVYLSTTYAHNKSMVVVSDKDFYTISLLLNGVTVLFEGDRTFQESVSPTNPKFQKIVQKSKSVEFSSSEEVMLAEFNRHGANYSIAIECDNPKSDKRCTEESFIRSLYSSIIMVGGRP